MNRRGFLQSVLAASVAPYIVHADALMRVYPNTMRSPFDHSRFPSNDVQAEWWPA